jgi:photosystem II stability/assembly factor-like uncharacterized protein
MKYIPCVFLILSQLALGQQYGWVPIAQIGNQSNGLASVTFVDSLYGWVGDGTTGFHYTQDGGNSWFPGSGATVVPYSISMLNRSVGWAAGLSGSFGGIHKTTNGGLSWTQQYYAINRNYLGTGGLTLTRNITSGQTRNFSPDTGKVVQTSNGGASWTERTIADSIRQLGSVQFVDSLHGWITSLSPAGVLRTVDGGVNWQFSHTQRGFPAISFIDTLRGWAVSYSPVTGIYRTLDGGSIWAFLYSFPVPGDDPTAKALSFIDSLNGWMFSTIFYQGDLASGIYRTTDGGWSWYREHAGQPRTMGKGLMLDHYHGWAVGSGGVVLAYRLVNSVPERQLGTPKTFSLRQNYPNPFNSTTTIEYEVPRHTMLQLNVVDIQGRVVRELVHMVHEPGVYRVRFDATGLASGVYFCTMKTEFSITTQQMTFLK